MMNNTPYASLSIAIGLALGTFTLPVVADGLIRDARIRPATEIQVSSSNAELDHAIDGSINFIYDYLVVGPQQYPTTEVADRITKFRDAGVPAVPSLWGSYHGTPTSNAQGYRENFCLRDVAHQTEGASILSLNEENFDMLQRFAFDALQDKRVQISDPNIDPLDPWATAQTKSFWQEYWTLWSYNFYGAPYYMDAGFQELPAPLELLEKIYTMYEQTGDPRWLNDTFMDYGKQLHEQFASRYDFNGNGIVDNRGNEGILPTLWEFEGASHIAEDELTFTLEADEQTGQLIIKKEYFARLGVQDMGLKVRFRNGKDDYLSVRINNLTDANNDAPVLNHDYFFFENTQTVPDIPLTFTVADGVSLQGVTDGDTLLTQSVDYTVVGNVVTLKSGYMDNLLRTQSYRYKFSFGFAFSDGNTERMVVEAGSRTYAKDILSLKTIDLDWNNLTDVVLDLDFSDTPVDNRDLYRIENSMNRVVEAGDTLGVQYQATLAYEKMLRAKADLVVDQQIVDQLITDADIYQAKAAQLLSRFQQDWYDDNTATYARAFDGYGNAIFGWGHENSFFMPMKDLLEPGQKANDYLQFIHDNSENLNEEAKTYLPEAFFNYGQNDRGWYWMQTGLERFFSDRTSEQQAKTYPEIAFTNVSNLITHMMGYQPKVHQGKIETLSRLPATMEFVQVDNLPVGQSIMDVNDYNRNIDDMVSLRHQNSHTSTLTNSATSSQPLIWKAQFTGSFDTLYVDETPITASRTSINGIALSYVELNIDAGQTITVSTNDGTVIPPVEPPLPTDTDLTSLTPVSQQADWGTIQTNKSVNGNPLRVGGQTYTKGIGTHATSQIVYDLAGQYSQFNASVGVDDEVSNGGSVQFKVFLDGALVFDSGVLTGADAAVPLSVDVSGASELRLVVEDGGDGINSDHADWLAPQLTVDSDVSLLTLTPTSISTGWGTTHFNNSVEGNPLTINGTVYSNGIGTHSTSAIVYDLQGQYQRFQTTVGLDDETGNNGSVGFEIYLDGTLAYASPVLLGTDAGHDIDIDISGAIEMTLITTDGGDNINHDHADWGAPMLRQ